MPENDNSKSLEDDSGRITTSLVKMVESHAGFLLSPQSSALITYILTLNTDTYSKISEYQLKDQIDEQKRPARYPARPNR
jgi:hypothetical protein